MVKHTLIKLITPLSLLAACCAVQAQGVATPLPAVGANWKYSYSDSLYGRHKQSFTVRADAVAGSTVSDTLAAESMSGSQAAFDSRAPRFVLRALAGGKTLVEALAYGAADAVPAVAGYPQGSKTFLEWKVVVQPAASEEIKVPAGSFRAQRIVIDGTRDRDGDAFWWPKEAGRFRYTLWFAPEAQRYVKARNQSWAMTGVEFGDELVELLEFRPN
jgi:hypothetical protein